MVWEAGQLTSSKTCDRVYQHCHQYQWPSLFQAPREADKDHFDCFRHFISFILCKRSHTPIRVLFIDLCDFNCFDYLLLVDAIGHRSHRHGSSSRRSHHSLLLVGSRCRHSCRQLPHRRHCRSPIRSRQPDFVPGENSESTLYWVGRLPIYNYSSC